ncbi:MAG: hypothetical protein JWP63_1474, partial [Candidatus Solibacter sp.]|nr:hypothetical protein [Candidatus Solibacter sp.]
HRYLPLVVALEFAAADSGDPPTPFPGPKLLENFVRQMAG